MKKEKKEKKGIGCATTLILLPIPGAIIYGLVSEKSDFAHSFIYGCVISFVFLIVNLISAAKEKKERRRAEKIEEFRAANAAKYSGVQTSTAAAKQSAARSERAAGGTITDVPKKRFCSECGAELGETAKFCPECGAPVPEKKKAPKKRFCPECGTEIPEGVKFCENCGTAAASAAGVTIPVTGRVNSVTVSDKPPVTRPAAKLTVTPQRSGAPASGAKGAAEALRRIIAQLADSDVTAPNTAGEMRLPVTEAQNEFMKLIGKGM